MANHTKNGLVYDGLTGQLVDSAFPKAPPTDIPEIWDRYVALVGKIVSDFEKKAAGEEDVKALPSKDVNAIVALGRTISHLKAAEAFNIAQIGGKAVKDLPTERLRALVSSVPEPTDAEIED